VLLSNMRIIHITEQLGTGHKGMVMSHMPEQAKLTVQKIGLIVLETVDQSGELGAPGFLLYATMRRKASVSQYNSFMTGLVNRGLLTQERDRYRITSEGLSLLGCLRGKLRAIMGGPSGAAAQPTNDDMKAA